VPRSELVSRMIPLLTEVLDRLPFMHSLNKAADIRAKARYEPSGAVNDLLDTIKSLEKEKELESALKEIGIDILVSL